MRLLSVGVTENRYSNPKGYGTFSFLRALTTGEVFLSPDQGMF